MKLNLYQCDICGKEHRRSDTIQISYIKNNSLEKYWEHLCSICEEKILDEINKIKEVLK